MYCCEYCCLVALFVLALEREGVLGDSAVTYAVTYPSLDDGSGGQVDIFVTSAYDAVVEVDGNSGAVTSYGLHTVTALVQSCSDVINVTADDVFVSVTTKGHNSGLNMDGFRPLPLSSLGNEYTVSAWSPSSGGVSFLVLKATDTGANITLDIPQTFPHQVTWMGVTYGNGTQFVISLQGNEAVQLNFTNVDPTGLHLLTSDGAVFGVLSGAIETAVNGSLPGNLYDVIPPHQLIGNFYVGVPLPGKDELIWRLVSTGVSNTVMFVLGQGGPGDLWVTLSQGEHADYVTNASNAVLIYSPKPAVVSLVTPSGCQTLLVCLAGDTHPPTMAVLCPMALWNTYYLINHLHSSGSRQEYVTITVATASSTGVRMTSAGGVTSLVTGWTTFDSSIFSMDHVTVQVTGVTSLWHASGKRFQVLQSAFAKDWGYTFSAGCDLGFGSPTTTTAATTLSSSPSVSTSPPTSTSTTAPSSSSPSSTATSTTPQSTHTTTPTSTVTMTSSTTTKISPPTSSASSVTVSNVRSVTAPHHPSNSPSLSWLPAWLDEESEWVVAGAAAGGVVVVAVVTLAVLVTIRKHQRTVAASALTARSSGTVTMVTRKHVTASAAHSVPVTTVKQTSLGGEGAKWGVVSASNTLRLQFKPRLVRRFSRGYMAHGVNMTPVETV